MKRSVVTPSEREQKRALDAIAKREKVLITQVSAVAQGYQPGAFVYGPGGLGKTHIITRVLEEMSGKSWQHHTSYSTAKALMISLAQFPDQVHLFEDCEAMYKNEVASSILRAALGNPRQRERVVTYETANERLVVRFSGGIIVASNEDICRTKGALAAVASRFRPIKWDLTTGERITRILEIAKGGWTRGDRTMTPKETMVVAKYLIDQALTGSVQQPIDIRTFTEHAIPAFMHHRDGTASVDWRQVIDAKLAGAILGPEKRADRNDRMRQIALGIHQKAGLSSADKVALWQTETGLGRAIYFRHLRAAKG